MKIHTCDEILYGGNVEYCFPPGHVITYQI